MIEQTIDPLVSVSPIPVERDPQRSSGFDEREKLAPQPGSSVRLGSLPEFAQHDLRFLQDRVALFGKITFLVSAMFLLATVAGDLVHGVVRPDPSNRIGHVTGTLLALILWLALRGARDHCAGALHAFDAAGTLGICLSFVAMGHQSLQPYGFYTSTLSIALICITRATIVPSSPGRTMLTSIGSFAGLLVCRALWPLSLELPALPGAAIRGFLEAGLWSVAASAVATVASRVIYGLQAKVREARQLGQYVLEERIGQGGMGEIYRAGHVLLRRPTAVKVMSGQGSEAQRKRFEREVQLTAKLTHPNTISIFDYGHTPDGLFYYAMELLDGLSLQELVERYGPLPPARVIHLLAQACGALREAHAIGLIHRDIKPANIHVCRRGDIADFVKVLDFGLVRELSGVGLSSPNAVVGTPLYLSPEAILDPAHIDARADIYALGCVAYYLVTGTTPFTGQNVVELCVLHLHAQAEPPSRRRRVPQDLENVILSCLSKDPAARPQTVSTLLAALVGCADAGGWSEKDADAWWRSIGEAAGPTRIPSAFEGEELPARVCRVDLKRRHDDLELNPQRTQIVTPRFGSS